MRILPPGGTLENTPTWPIFRVRAQTAFALDRPRRPDWLRRNVRIDLPLEPGDLVFQEELPALETLELELVVDELVAEALDHVVKIAMLDLALHDALLEHGALDFVHGRGHLL